MIENYQTPLQRKSFCNIGTGFKFFKKFINIIKTFIIMLLFFMELKAIIQIGYNYPIKKL